MWSWNFKQNGWIVFSPKLPKKWDYNHLSQPDVFSILRKRQPNFKKNLEADSCIKYKVRFGASRS